MKLIKLLGLLLLLTSCKGNNDSETLKTEEKNTDVNIVVNETDYSDESLDNLLKCGDYSYMDGYFTIPDYGCIYQSNITNKLGNVEVYLIPKEKFNVDGDIDKAEIKINKMDINSLKESYDICIFLIDKKYLKHNVNMDVPYYPNYPYKQIIFKNINGLWKKSITLNINSENDSQYKDWKNKFLNNSNQILKDKNIELKGDYVIKTDVSSVETGNPIGISFYFNFRSSEAILSIGTNNSLEAYCEGTYSITQDNDTIKLKYTGEGICTSDESESMFLIKKEKDQYYIKSKRFYDYKWQILNKK
ncbi:hypothetical protein [Flavobacterium sp. WC2509]|uniref:hypothetical protein n=1 Tax=Flavobacterium sp. WC2509 TaxID=3461406 RepID=UPI0040447515